MSITEKDIKSFFLDSAQNPLDVKKQFKPFELIVLKEFGEMLLDETKELFESLEYVYHGFVEEEMRFKIESIQYNLDVITVVIANREKHNAFSYFDMNDVRNTFYFGKN